MNVFDEYPSNSVPLVIGVTGHRDIPLADTERLQEKVGSIIKELQNRYPITPIILLSPLAEGADRIAAKAALEMKAKLIVPLPMQREEYEKDFLTRESRGEFNQLLEQSERWFTVQPEDSEQSIHSEETPDDSRDLLYKRVGDYIVQTSQLLIALWDGTENNFRGGTSSVVRAKLNGFERSRSSLLTRLHPDELGPVHHIGVRRETSPPRSAEPFSETMLYPARWGSEIEAGRYFDRICQRIEDFNNDAKCLRSSAENDIEVSRSYLIEAETAKKFPAPVTDIFNRFAIADALAIRYQVLSIKSLKFIFSMIPVAALSLKFYLGAMRPAHFLLAYLVALTSMYVCDILENKGKYKQKYLDYRAMAEGLRVQLFWTMTGVKESVADHYLTKQRTELDWIRVALANVLFYEGKVKGGEIPNSERSSYYSITKSNWIEDQSRYFSKSTARNKQRIDRLRGLMKWSYLGSLCGALPLIVIQGLAPVLSSSLEQVLQLLIVVGPLIVGTLGPYADKMAYSAQAKQFERMAELFVSAEELLSIQLQQGEQTGVVVLLRDVGKEALAENGDWVLMHRERPVEVPKK